MKAVEKASCEELTIVSRRLLRVEASDWETPTEQFRCLQGNALELLLSVMATTRRGRQLDLRVLLLLDCMLRVIDEPNLTSPLAFSSTRFKSLQMLFYGALGSFKFINVAAATRISWAEAFFRIVERLSEVTPVAVLEHHQGYRTPIPENFIHAFDELHLHEEEVLALRPFLLRTKAGLEYNVCLADMVPALGRPFADDFHAGLCDIARPKAKDTALRDFGTTLARFVAHRHAAGQEVTPELLLRPSFVQMLVVDFMEYHFMKITRRRAPVQEATLSSLQKLWSRYETYWGALARRGILAAPSAFPAGNPKLLTYDSVAHRRVAPAADGSATVVTQKLLVSVPLHVTDEEATQLLFKQLRHDFTTVQDWLKDHLKGLFEDRDRGCALADSVKELPSDEHLWSLPRLHWQQPDSVPLALKYLKQQHGGYVNTSSVRTVLYPHLGARDGPSKKTLSRLLGLPSRLDAMALMGFLASTDGRFSEAAMASAVLLDANGRRINAVETDAGITLTVCKERDADDGWQDVSLNSEAAVFVRRWIQLTEPLRSYMREHGIAGWRNLFVYVGKPLGAPGHFNRSTNINSAFRTFALANQEFLGELANQVTIPRIRSTRGVLVFLESMDLASMARELGNTNETSLRHYLPDSLWDYFSNRWLRIFQNLLIVAATKDTPYMQRALRFGSAAEMDEFLRNHAVTSIIPLDEDVNESTPNKLSEVMIPASPGLFTILLSIVAAADKVEAQGGVVTSHAVYWAEFTKRLMTYIESEAFHDRGVKRMLATAAANTDPTAFEEVVCA